MLHSDATLLDECAAQTQYHGLDADEVFVMPSPVAHVSGLIYGVLLPIFLGATSVLLARWDATAFLTAIERERGTFSGGATPFLEGLVDHPDLERFNLTSFRRFPCGGADVPPDLIRRARRASASSPGAASAPRSSRASRHRPAPTSRTTSGPRRTGARSARTAFGSLPTARSRPIGPELFLGYLDTPLTRRHVHRRRLVAHRRPRHDRRRRLPHHRRAGQGCRDPARREDPGQGRGTTRRRTSRHHRRGDHRASRRAHRRARVRVHRGGSRSARTISRRDSASSFVSAASPHDDFPNKSRSSTPCPGLPEARSTSAHYAAQFSPRS